MATQVLTNCKLWLAGYDLSGDMNALGLTYAAELQENTTFGSDTRTRAGGLKTIVAQHEGLWNANGSDGPDDVLFSRIGASNVPMSVAPTTGAAGEVAYTFRCALGNYVPGGQVGEMFRFSVSAEGSDGAPLVKGTVLHNGTQTATGTGTGYLIGAASSGQRVYGALHVLSASASDTLDVVVQSDTASNFPSPVTALTFAQQTAVGSDWQSAAGPITDTYYRVSFTLGGTSPSFEFVVVLGIK